MEIPFYKLKQEGQKRGPYNLIIATLIIMLWLMIGGIPSYLIMVLNSGELSLNANLYSFSFLAIISLLWTKWVDGSPLAGLGIGLDKQPLKEFLRGVLVGAGLLGSTCLFMAIFGYKLRRKPTCLRVG